MEDVGLPKNLLMLLLNLLPKREKSFEGLGGTDCLDSAADDTEDDLTGAKSEGDRVMVDAMVPPLECLASLVLEIVGCEDGEGKGASPSPISGFD